MAHGIDDLDLKSDEVGLAPIFPSIGRRNYINALILEASTSRRMTGLPVIQCPYCRSSRFERRSNTIGNPGIIFFKCRKNEVRRV